MCKSSCALGGDLLIQVLNAAWHSDSWRERESILRSCTSTCTCIAYRKTHVKKTPAHTHRQCCAIFFPLDACCIIMPTIHLEMHDTEIPVGCCARVYGSKLFNCSPCLWLELRWWAESKLRQHRLKLALHPGSSRLFCCEPTQQFASAHCLFSHSSNRWRRRSHRHQASCASGPICREYGCDCCFKVGAILKCQTPLFQSLMGLL